MAAVCPILEFPLEVLESVVLRFGGGGILATCKRLFSENRTMFEQFRWQTLFPTLSQTRPYTMYPYVMDLKPERVVENCPVVSTTFPRAFTRLFTCCSLSYAYFWSAQFRMCYRFGPQDGFTRLECRGLPVWVAAISDMGQQCRLYANEEYVVVMADVRDKLCVAMLDLTTLGWVDLGPFDVSLAYRQLPVIITAGSCEIEYFYILNNTDRHEVIRSVDPVTGNPARFGSGGGVTVAVHRVCTGKHYGSEVWYHDYYGEFKFVYSVHGVFFLIRGLLYILHNHQFHCVVPSDQILMFMSQDYNRMVVVGGDLLLLHRRNQSMCDVFFINTSTVAQAIASGRSLRGVIRILRTVKCALGDGDVSVKEAIICRDRNDTDERRLVMRVFYPIFGTWTRPDFTLTCGPAGIELVVGDTRFAAPKKWLYVVRNPSIDRRGMRNRVKLVVEPDVALVVYSEQYEKPVSKRAKKGGLEV